MIIAEIGINHEGSEKTAMAILKRLLKTSIDAITFQIPSQEYLDGSEPKRRPLSNNFYDIAISQTHQSNKLIGFACADLRMVEFLDGCGTDFWKTLSWDILNKELQEELQKTSKMIFISTGVSGIDDIIRVSSEYENIKFIHTQISNKIDLVNLEAIRTISNKTHKEVAFGLHCNVKDVVLVSLAYNPSDIFFYVKKDDDDSYPDGPHAFTLDEVDTTVNNIKTLKRAIGDGNKVPVERQWN